MTDLTVQSHLMLWKTVINALIGDQIELSIECDTSYGYTIDECKPHSVVERQVTTGRRDTGKKTHGLNRIAYYVPINEAVKQIEPRLSECEKLYPSVIRDRRFDKPKYYWIGLTNDKRQHLCAINLCNSVLVGKNVDRLHFADHVSHFEDTNIRNECNPCKYKCSQSINKLYTHSQLRHHYSTDHPDHIPKSQNRHMQGNPIHLDQTNAIDPPQALDLNQADVLYNVELPATRQPVIRLLQRSARQLLIVKHVKLDYWSHEHNQLIQWVPNQCSSKQQSIDCLCRNKLCLMYCNGHRLRWVYASVMPYLGCFPQYRCYDCNCAGGAFTQQYAAADNVNITPDIIAYGG